MCFGASSLWNSVSFTTSYYAEGAGSTSLSMRDEISCFYPSNAVAERLDKSRKLLFLTSGVLSELMRWITGRLSE